MILHLSMALQATEALLAAVSEADAAFVSSRGTRLCGLLHGQYPQGTTRMEGVHA
jgi:hypothetical protein